MCRRNIFFAILNLILTSACAVLTSEPKNMETVRPERKVQQEREVEAAEQMLNQKNWLKADELYQQFFRAHPYSIFLQRARFGYAKSLEEQGHWSEAVEIYRNIIDAAQSNDPEILAEAYFLISFCYENLGDEARVLTSLEDAKNLQQYLTPERRLAEIPVRIAASYYRQDRKLEGQRLLDEANEGLQQLRAIKTSEGDTQWLAKMYQQMGHFSTNQLSDENIEASLDTWGVIQIFSLRSAEEGFEPWSSISSGELIENYQNLWRVIRILPPESRLETGTARRKQLERQIGLTEKMLEQINNLKLYELPEVSEKSAYVKKVFVFLEELKKQAQAFLAKNSIRNPLTPEAEALGGLKR